MSRYADSIIKSPVVFLTGAGASAPLELPTTAEFLNLFRSEGLGRQIPEALDPNANEFQFAADRMNAPSCTDIETLLTAFIDHGKWSQQFSSDEAARRHLARNMYPPGGLPSEGLTANEDRRQTDISAAMTTYTSLNHRFAVAVRKEIIRSYGSVNRESAARLYASLFGSSGALVAHEYGCGRTIPFFTLNYDLAVEVGAGSNDMRVFAGFVEDPGGPRHWSDCAFETYEESDSRTTVVVVHLHGSVRLAYNKENSIVEVPAGLGADPDPFRHALLDPILGPKDLNPEPFRTHYRLFRSCLLHAEMLFIIGSTLRDRELTDLIGDCVTENDRLHVVVISPELSVNDVTNRLMVTPNRVGIVKGYFEIESNDVLVAGGGELVNALRRWWSTSRGQGPHKFGTETPLQAVGPSVRI